jgi:hercynylcysteine S-oxide lyase
MLSLKVGFKFRLCEMWLRLHLASITYDAVDKATRFVSEIHPGLKSETIAVSPPYTLEGMFGAFEAGLKKVQSSPEYLALTELGQRPKIVVIVDALSSTPGLLMPWERVVELCKQHENVWSLVDAAQAVGQIVGIDLNMTQPDFFISVGAISAE